jgi:RNA polymerase sigma-70 factor (ECF subfamily)
LREPLLLCGVDDLSHAEAAEALGITAKAVELRIRRARAALAADRMPI